MGICIAMPTTAISLAFGRVLREQRERASLSQEELAKAAQLNRTYISLLERGIRQPTLETLFRIADALSVAPSTLVAKTTTELSK